MYSRWCTTAVILLWLSTMGWLVTAKLLPSLLLGDPPSYQSILQDRGDVSTVAWRLLCNSREVGWAESLAAKLPDGGTRIDNHIHFDDLPVDQLAPAWLQGIFNMAGRPGKSALHDAHATGPDLAADAATSMVINDSNRLSAIKSTISFPPLGEKISMRGIVDGNVLKLKVRAPDISFQTQITIADDALVCDAFMPTIRLPGLYEGQTWTMSVLSPLAYPNRTHDILLAKVEGCEEMQWNGRPTAAWLVVYRDMPGKSLGASARPRGRLWVRRDGVVLKQEISLFNSSMTFVRLPEK